MTESPHGGEGELPKRFQWRLGLGSSKGKQSQAATLHIPLLTPAVAMGLSAIHPTQQSVPEGINQFPTSSLPHQPLFVLWGHHRPAGLDSHHRHHHKPQIPTRAIPTFPSPQAFQQNSWNSSAGQAYTRHEYATLQINKLPPYCLALLIFQSAQETSGEGNRQYFTGEAACWS